MSKMERTVITEIYVLALCKHLNDKFSFGKMVKEWKNDEPFHLITTNRFLYFEVEQNDQLNYLNVLIARIMYSAMFLRTKHKPI